MKIRLSVLILVLFVKGLFSQQYEVKGVVHDSKTKEPLAFVNISTDNNKTGTTTDIDGKFSIIIDSNTCCLRFSYVGYENLDVKVDNAKKYYFIKLIQKPIDLNEVIVLPGINKAHRIIDSVMNHKKENNPRNIKAFTYTTYDKIILTVKNDSLLINADTTLMDSTQKKTRDFFLKQNLFLMETVTERKYLYPDLNQETVLATKVSGFKDPIIVFMISKIQSADFYDNTFKIFDKTYINPLSPGSKKKYYFQIEDTTYTAEKDTVFIISFRPLLKTHFDGLKGLLYINTKKWALQNVKAEPVDESSGMKVQIQQAYDFIQGHWFPVQLNTDIDFLATSIKIGDTTMPVVAIGKSYLRDINLNPNLKKQDFGYHEIEIEQDAVKKKGEFWKKFRVDSLTVKEKETYKILDSIGKAENFDKLTSTTAAFMNGRIPVKFVDIEIDKLFHYNQHEGFYAGVGLKTNNMLSKRFTIGGYWGYGFGDKTAKYGFNGSVVLHKRSETSLYVNAYRDVLPSGGVSFGNNNQRIWNTNDFYTFFYKRMNFTEGINALLSFRIKAMRDFKWYSGFNLQNKTAFGNYYFHLPNQPAVSKFSFRETILGFKFAYREKTIQTTRGYISLGSIYPVVFLKYTHGFKDIFNGDFEYDKIDLKIEQTLHIRYIGDFSYKIVSGKVFGDIPACNLYNANGSYAPFTVYAPNSFGTMRPGEFLSDQYVFLYLSHNFKNLLYKGKGVFNPQLTLITNAGIGSLKTPQYHFNYDFKTMEKGYFESGFLIRKIIDLSVYDIGIGLLYRYGSYRLPRAEDNFAVKFTLFYGL